MIVQRHLDAQVAGVLFADGDNSSIEASWGLGESVVQGTVTPDAFTVAADGRVERRLGSKQTRVDRRAEGTVTSDVPQEQRDQFCLTDRQLQDLSQLGAAVVTELRAPQDIEFAWDSTGLWLLQSRPITAPTPAGHLTATPMHHGVAADAGTLPQPVAGTAGTVREGADDAAGTAREGLSGQLLGPCFGELQVVRGRSRGWLGWWKGLRISGGSAQGRSWCAGTPILPGRRCSGSSPVW